MLTSPDLQLLQTRPGGSETDRQRYSFIMVLFSTSNDLENSLRLQAVFSSGRVGFHSHGRLTARRGGGDENDDRSEPFLRNSDDLAEEATVCALKRVNTAEEISVDAAAASVLSADGCFGDKRTAPKAFLGGQRCFAPLAVTRVQPNAAVPGSP